MSKDFQRHTDIHIETHIICFFNFLKEYYSGICTLGPFCLSTGLTRERSQIKLHLTKIYVKKRS